MTGKSKLHAKRMRNRRTKAGRTKLEDPKRKREKVRYKEREKRGKRERRRERMVTWP
jgi:hypothetical protein